MATNHNEAQLSPSLNQKSFMGLGIVLIVLIPVLCCLGPIMLVKSPFMYCLDPFSSHVPFEAQERFIQRVIEKTLEEDYDWLVSVSTETAAQKLMELKPKMSANFTIGNSDSLGASYQQRIEFDNGTSLHLVFDGTWSTCPDFNVTEQEIFQNLRLIYVTESVFPTPTSNSK